MCRLKTGGPKRQDFAQNLKVVKKDTFGIDKLLGKKEGEGEAVRFITTSLITYADINLEMIYIPSTPDLIISGGRSRT